MNTDQLKTWVRIGELLHRHGHALSAFEMETISEINERLRILGSQAMAVSPAEWTVVEGALDAMARASGRPGRKAA